MKQLKKKLFFLKVKIFFIFVLPGVIVLLAAKVVETLARIKLRQMAVSFPWHHPEKKPVSMTRFQLEVVTPQPVAAKQTS